MYEDGSVTESRALLLESFSSRCLLNDMAAAYLVDWKSKGMYIDTSHTDTNRCDPSPRGVSGTHMFVSVGLASN